MRIRYRLLAALCAGALLLSACTSPSSTGTLNTDTSSDTVSSEDLTPQYGGTLTICDSHAVSNIGYPAYMSSGSPIRQASPALETLFQLTEDGQIQPKLVLTYEEDHENNTLTLHLRSNVTFHDGTTFDSYAVRWNLEHQVIADATGTQNIEKITTPDEQTLVIFLSEWDNTLLPSLAQAQGLMISPTAFEKNGGTEWAASHPVGTGPFIFESWDEDGTLTYVRNPNYWDSSKPYLDSIVIVCDSDSSSREYGLRSGSYDVLIRGDLSSLPGLAAEGYTVNSVACTGPWGLVFDSANEDSPFARIEVRKAVCCAINKSELISDIYLDTVTETNQYAVPGMDTYNDDVLGYSFNLPRARQLMKDAGYEDGFTTTFHYDMTADNADDLAHALKDMLAEINIELELDPISNSKSTTMLQKGIGWDGIMGTFGSSQYDTLTQLYNYMVGDLKYVSMAKPQTMIDDICRAATADTEESRRLILEVQKILIDEECLCCYLFANTDYTILSPSVHDTNLSSIMPVTIWTPADAWKE